MKIKELIMKIKAKVPVVIETEQDLFIPEVLCSKNQCIKGCVTRCEGISCEDCLLFKKNWDNFRAFVGNYD